LLSRRLTWIGLFFLLSKKGEQCSNGNHLKLDLENNFGLKIDDPMWQRALVYGLCQYVAIEFLALTGLFRSRHPRTSFGTAEGLSLCVGVVILSLVFYLCELVAVRLLCSTSNRSATSAIRWIASTMAFQELKDLALSEAGSLVISTTEKNLAQVTYVIPYTLILVMLLLYTIFIVCMTISIVKRMLDPPVQKMNEPPVPDDDGPAPPGLVNANILMAMANAGGIPPVDVQQAFLAAPVVPHDTTLNLMEELRFVSTSDTSRVIHLDPNCNHIRHLRRPVRRTICSDCKNSYLIPHIAAWHERFLE
jgi:hypothetical protein